MTAAVEAMYATGHWLLSSSRHIDAAKVFQAMVLVDSRDERGWLALGACHEALGQPELALDLYRVGILAASPAPRCALARARALRARAEDDADDAFVLAIDLALEAGDDEVAQLGGHRTMTVNLDRARAAETLDATYSAPAPSSVAASAGPTLPPPQMESSDAVAAMMALYLDGNHEDSISAKLDIEQRNHEKAEARKRQAEAVAAAEAAAKEKRGFFDSIGLAGVVGLATASPVVVLADMTMHMARQTPKVLKEFEDDHKDSIALAAKLYCAVGSGATLAASGGALTPATARAALSLGGVLVRETGVLGAKTSDRVGAALMMAGDPASGAAAIAAQKDGAVADDVRAVQRDTEKYNKYITYGAMAVAAGAAIVGSFGTATAPVVIVGVALSAGGVLSSETHALDSLVGAEAAAYINGGAMLGGAVISGVGVAALGTQGVNATAAALELAADGVTSAANVQTGLELVENTVVRHEVDENQVIAKRFENESRNLGRLVDDLIDRAKGYEKDVAQVRGVAENIVQTQCDTREMAATSLLRG